MTNPSTRWTEQTHVNQGGGGGNQRRGRLFEKGVKIPSANYDQSLTTFLNLYLFQMFSAILHQTNLIFMKGNE